MASDFPASICEDIERSSVQEYTPSQTAGETAAKAGELMFFDTADQKIKRCAANPALIAGIAEVVSESARVLTPNGKIPLRLLVPACGVRMCVTGGTLAEANVAVATGYNISRLSSGNWAVDIGNTGSARVFIYRADVDTQAAFVHFIAANLQFDAIAS